LRKHILCHLPNPPTGVADQADVLNCAFVNRVVEWV
jgi:hypothetical protein